MNDTRLIKYHTACRALAEAKAVDEVKDLRDKADAMRIYAMQAKNKTLEVDAAEIRIRAERRLGEMIALQKTTVGLNTGSAGLGINQYAKEVRSSPTTAPKLADVGISKDLSSRAQKLAAVPNAQFESEIGQWRERVQQEGARVVTRLEAAGEKALEQKPDNPLTDEALANLNNETDIVADYAKQLEENQDLHAEIIRLHQLLTHAEDKLKQQATTIETMRHSQQQDGQIINELCDFFGIKDARELLNVARKRSAATDVVPVVTAINPTETSKPCASQGADAGAGEDEAHAEVWDTSGEVQAMHGDIPLFDYDGFIEVEL